MTSPGTLLRSRAETLHARILQRLQQRSRRFWLWLFASLIVAELLLYFLYHLFWVLPGHLEQDAFRHHRRIVVDLTGGDVLIGSQHTPAAAGAAHPLNGAPYDAITEPSPTGPLPKISGDVMAWQYYAKPYRPQTHGPKIAVVISRLGMRPEDVETALHLPQQVTLGLSPYAPHVAETAEHMRALGYETMIDIPLEPADYPYSDPGPAAVLTGNDEKGNLMALHQALSRFAGYTGGVASGDEVITGSESRMPLLVKEFTHRGILLLYGRKPGNERFTALPFSNAWSAMPGEELLDGLRDPAILRRNLAALLETAKTQGTAIGILQSYPAGLRILQDWLASLEKQHVELVPLSVIASSRYHIYSTREESPAKPAASGHEDEEKGGEKKTEGEKSGEEAPAKPEEGAAHE
jgi:polysaccharide deacetylase 2 family uncharacterized protein YibQ